MVFLSCDICIHGMVAHGKAVVRSIQQIDRPEFCACLDIIIIAKMHHFFGRFNSTQYRVFALVSSLLKSAYRIVRVNAVQNVGP